MSLHAPSPLVGFIASKNATPALEKTVGSLLRAGARKVIVVDDGSDKIESQTVFDAIELQYGNRATVLHLPKNIGKAAALREGFKLILPGSIIIQTDDDTIAGESLRGAADLIRRGKTDIVDIRVEVVRTASILGLSQELDYWAINAIVKRIQNWVRARTWMSGASVMYSYAAGEVLILPEAHSITEDTEGLFRAHSKGLQVRFYSRRSEQFYTMVPEDFKGMRRQWQRWATGNAQVLSLHKLGGGNLRVAASNGLSWLQTLMMMPVLSSILFGVASTLEWMFISGMIIGMIGAVSMRRPVLALLGWTLPIASALWAYHAVEGIFLARQRQRTGNTTLTWTPPVRKVARVTA